MPRGQRNLDPAGSIRTDRLRRKTDLCRRHLDGKERRRVPTRTEPGITTPQEHHVCVQPMLARHRRDRGASLKRLGNHTALERPRISAGARIANATTQSNANSTHDASVGGGHRGHQQSVPSAKRNSKPSAKMQNFVHMTAGNAHTESASKMLRHERYGRTGVL